MYLKLLILSPLLFLLVVCTPQKQTTETQIKVKEVKEKTLQETSTQLTIGANTLILETYLWRDFMPSPDRKSGNPLLSSTKLIDKNKKALPTSLKMKKQYLLQGENIWKTNFDEIHASEPYKRVAVLRNGPELEPGTEVDVICEFEYDGKTYRIAAKSQTIEATH